MTTSTMTKCDANTAVAERCDTISCTCRQTPAVDIHETEAAYVLEANVPGVAPEGVSLELKEDQLVLEAKATFDEAAAKRRGYGEITYRRVFNLGKGVAREDLKAELKHGVLTVTVPKAPERQPRKITVTG